MFQIPSLARRIHRHSRVGVGCGATRVERAAHSSLPTRCQNAPTLACGGDCGAARSSCAAHNTSPSHTLSKEKKTHSLTLLLQNHLDHVNILLPGLRARPPVLSHVPLHANHRPLTSPQQSASGSAAPEQR